MESDGADLRSQGRNGARKAFDRNLAGIAAKRGVPVEQLASIKTWFELIEHDEGRM
jgi:hypothetical protein